MRSLQIAEFPRSRLPPFWALISETRSIINKWLDDQLTSPPATGRFRNCTIPFGSNSLSLFGSRSWGLHRDSTCVRRSKSTTSDYGASGHYAGRTISVRSEFFQTDVVFRSVESKYWRARAYLIAVSSRRPREEGYGNDPRRGGSQRHVPLRERTKIQTLPRPLI